MPKSWKTQLFMGVMAVLFGILLGATPTRNESQFSNLVVVSIIAFAMICILVISWRVRKLSQVPALVLPSFGERLEEVVRQTWYVQELDERGPTSLRIVDSRGEVEMESSVPGKQIVVLTLVSVTMPRREFSIAFPPSHPSYRIARSLNFMSSVRFTLLDNQLKNDDPITETSSHLVIEE